MGRKDGLHIGSLTCEQIVKWHMFLKDDPVRIARFLIFKLMNTQKL